MRIGLIGGGTIARLVLEHVRRGTLPGLEIVALLGRPGGSGSQGSRGQALAAEYGIPYLTDRGRLLENRPDVVVEAASHDAVREHLLPVLESGTGFVVLSAGALIDDRLRHAAEQAAERHRALLYVPSGGIGALDTLRTACLAGVDEVSIQVAKPPAAWRGIPYVERLGVDLSSLKEPKTLFEGPAREGVPHFPQNVNIAAILSLGGIGPDRTRLKVVADPSLTLNTHTIRVSGACGRFTLVLENVPSPDNPKTSWLACYSALAALQTLPQKVRYGT